MIILHISVAVRVYGDLAINPEIRILGSLLNALAIALFFAMTLMSIIFLRSEEK